jgi:16S rRNA C967 or C1407 C5-methylase (RsmB/RsmF family)
MPEINKPLNTNPALNEYLYSLLQQDYEKFVNSKTDETSIRLNTLYDSYTEIPNVLINLGCDIQRLPFNNTGYIVHNSPFSLSQTLCFFKGQYTFQSASSQIPPLVLDPKPGERVLDMAASPGSKTTQIAGLMKNQGQLVVNDSNLKRM